MRGECAMPVDDSQAAAAEFEPIVNGVRDAARAATFRRSGNRVSQDIALVGTSRRS